MVGVDSNPKNHLLFKIKKKIGLSLELLFRKTSSAVTDNIGYVLNFFKKEDVNKEIWKEKLFYV